MRLSFFKHTLTLRLISVSILAKMTDTWQNEVGTIKVNDRGMRLAQRDGLGETLLEGQVSLDG